MIKKQNFIFYLFKILHQSFSGSNLNSCPLGKRHSGNQARIQRPLLESWNLANLICYNSANKNNYRKKQLQFDIYQNQTG
jgi:hypothetical protein